MIPSQPAWPVNLFLVTSPCQSEQRQLVLGPSWTFRWIFLLFPKAEKKPNHGERLIMVMLSFSWDSLAVCTVNKDHYLSYRSSSPCCCCSQTDCHCWQKVHFSHSDSPLTPIKGGGVWGSESVIQERGIKKEKKIFFVAYLCWSVICCSIGLFEDTWK